MNAEKKVTNEISGVEIINCYRRCGCIRTSDKLKKILDCFPSPPPVQCPFGLERNKIDPDPNKKEAPTHGETVKNEKCKLDKNENKWTLWNVITELVQLVQLSVTATALAFYYIIYCYMQLVYYTLRSAIYFHNADIPMKITIGVVTATSMLVGFNILLRIEKLINK